MRDCEPLRSMALCGKRFECAGSDVGGIPDCWADTPTRRHGNHDQHQDADGLVDDGLMLITVGIISINIAIINYVISIISTIIATARGSISTIIIIVFVFFYFVSTCLQCQIHLNLIEERRPSERAPSWKDSLRASSLYGPYDC